MAITNINYGITGLVKPPFSDSKVPNIRSRYFPQKIATSSSLIHPSLPSLAVLPPVYDNSQTERKSDSTITLDQIVKSSPYKLMKKEEKIKKLP